MTLLDQITVLILTYNEEENLDRTLRALAWAPKILIVDSGSNDNTRHIVDKYPRVQIVYRKFDNFASQCNFGLSQITTGWVLSLDADYEVSETLVREIGLLSPADEIAGYSASFVYRVYGHALRSTLYPPRTVLYRRDCAHYRNEGHGHRVVIDGVVLQLQGTIAHDDRKTLARWFNSQCQYARIETEHLLTTPRTALNRSDRIRLIAWPAPILVFLYTLIAKRCLFDGWPGWFYVLQRTLAEIMLALEIIDRRLPPRSE